MSAYGQQPRIKGIEGAREWRPPLPCTPGRTSSSSGARPTRGSAELCLLLQRSLDSTGTWQPRSRRFEHLCVAYAYPPEALDDSCPAVRRARATATACALEAARGFCLRCDGRGASLSGLSRPPRKDPVVVEQASEAVSFVHARHRGPVLRRAAEDTLQNAYSSAAGDRSSMHVDRLSILCADRRSVSRRQAR